MKISRIDCHVLVDPEYDPAATSSAQDDFVVEVHTDEGVVGIGESDINPWIARACVEAPGTHTMDLGLRNLLLGADPLDSAAVWQRAYVGTAMAGRRGALIHALGAIDMALWDIRGKVAGKPVWQLIGDQRPDPVRAYASLEPEVGDFDAYVDSMVRWAKTAVSLGFRAVKAEATFSGPYANMGLRADDEKMTELLTAVRAAIGPDIALMVDVQYAFDSVDRARASLEAWSELDLYFVETPLWIDDLDDYAKLVDASNILIAAGEWQATRHEFADLIHRGKLDVVQPDIGRVGGLTEAIAVCEMAAGAGRLIVPHVWKTGISLAAAAHLATVTPRMPYFEFLHPDVCESRLRKELVDDEVHVVDGVVQPPRRPGLGIELNRDKLDEFADAATRLYS
ncbi:mandelate racemase/muconate lactonizing enzyme family protein [Streptomyces tubercidicus]